MRTRRFERAAFVSMEENGDRGRMLFALGEQMVPDFVRETGGDWEQGRQLLERELRSRRVVIVVDNMESVLPPVDGSEMAYEPRVLEGILELCTELMGHGETRLVFTSRQALPEPFDAHPVRLGRLDREDAVEIVGRVLERYGAEPRGRGRRGSEGGDRRAGGRRPLPCAQPGAPGTGGGGVGVRNATQRLHELMASLAAKYPDDRERSLFASVELSLRRLPAGTRERMRPLGVFQGGRTLRRCPWSWGSMSRKVSTTSWRSSSAASGSPRGCPTLICACIRRSRRRSGGSSARRSARASTGRGWRRWWR